MAPDRPDPRLLEDMIVRGAIALRRSRRDVTDAQRLAQIEQAESWLLDRARKLREAARG